MSKNYAALAQQIVAAIGGVDNVAARYPLYDPSALRG